MNKNNLTDEENRQANILCIISIATCVLSILGIAILSSIVVNLELSNSLLYINVIFVASLIASLVIIIASNILYKGHVLSKVILIVYIVIIVLIILAMIALIALSMLVAAACNSCCGGCYNLMNALQ